MLMLKSSTDVVKMFVERYVDDLKIVLMNKTREKKEGEVVGRSSFYTQSHYKLNWSLRVQWQEHSSLPGISFAINSGKSA